jgi:hypothetical protein
VGYSRTIQCSTLQPMLLIPESTDEQALLYRSIPALRHLLGASVHLRFRASDGSSVDAADVERLLKAGQQRVGIGRDRVVVQSSHQGRQIHQLNGQLVDAVAAQSGDHGLERGDPARIA